MTNVINNFLSYYEYKVKKLDIKDIPEHLFNKFHDCNLFGRYLYSGSEHYRNIKLIRDWTTDEHAADRFADDMGFIVSIPKEGFIKRFKFISMDLLYDYLVANVSNAVDAKRLEYYTSESEIYAISLIDLS